MGSSPAVPSMRSHQVQNAPHRTSVCRFSSTHQDFSILPCILQESRQAIIDVDHSSQKGRTLLGRLFPSCHKLTAPFII